MITKKRFDFDIIICQADNEVKVILKEIFAADKRR